VPRADVAQFVEEGLRQRQVRIEYLTISERQPRLFWLPECLQSLHDSGHMASEIPAHIQVGSIYVSQLSDI
jgi:hypothetical protein